MIIKIAWCLFFILLTIYPPIELTRLIISTGVPLDELLEMIIFWSFYAGAIFLFSWLVFKGRLPGIY